MLKAVARVAAELVQAVEQVRVQVQAVERVRAAVVLEALAQEARDLEREPAVAGTLHR
jgi:hypothetical protein